MIDDKAKRYATKLEERKHGPQRERELLLKQLEADKLTRKDKYVFKGRIHTVEFNKASKAQLSLLLQISANHEWNA